MVALVAEKPGDLGMSKRNGTTKREPADEVEDMTADKLLLAAIALVASGDDEKCDGVVMVGETEYHELRKLVHEKTGVLYGKVEEPGEPQGGP